QIARAERLYARLSAGRVPSPVRTRAVSMVRSGWPFLVSLLVTLAAFQIASPVWAAVTVLAGHGLAFWLVFGSLSRRLGNLLALRPDAFQDPIIARTYSDERGLMSRLGLVMISEEARIRTALARIDDQAERSEERRVGEWGRARW